MIIKNTYLSASYFILCVLKTALNYLETGGFLKQLDDIILLF